MEFQALHSVHWPSHLLNSAPHSLQTKAVFRFAISVSLALLASFDDRQYARRFDRRRAAPC
jgi:hypothetical protein